MNFSSFFKYSTLFFLFCLLVNIARPIGYNDSPFVGQPIVVEIPRIPQSYPLLYKSLFVDKGNRLFITTDQEVLIYDGVNYQNIKTTGKPILAFDNQGKIVIADDNYLSLLTLNDSGKYRINQIINLPNSNFYHKIIGLGIDNQKVYFSTGSTLWIYNDKPTPIDSSIQAINIFNTNKGLVFYSYEKGFYKIEDKTIQPLRNIKNITPQAVVKIVAFGNDFLAVTQNFPWFYNLTSKDTSLLNSIHRNLQPHETVLNVCSTGSYIFISTSTNCLLMIDSKSKSVNRFVDFGGSLSITPTEICTANDTYFFVITPTQIFSFIKPELVQLFNYKKNLKGIVNAAIEFKNQLYIATSYGLYTGKNLKESCAFELIEEGNFNAFTQNQGLLFAIGSNGLYVLSDNSVDRIISKPMVFSKTCFTRTIPSKAIFLDSQGRVYYSNLAPPFLLHEIQRSNSSSFVNFFSTDSLLLLVSDNQEWYTYSFDCNNPSGQGCLSLLQTVSQNNQPIVNGDTLSILNDRLVKTYKTGVAKNIGVTNIGQQIANIHSVFRPNYQTIILEKGFKKGCFLKQKNLYSLDNTFEVNAAFLDSDSCGWISTSQGLIKISADYIRSQNNTSPSLYVLSIATHDGDIIHPLYNGIIPEAVKTISEFKIKHCRTIEITLSSLDDFNWKNLTYSIKIQGSESKWKEWTTNSKFILSDLNPGRYIVIAKVRNVYDFESPELKFTFNIVPDFFQTKFTRISLIVLVLLSFFSFYQWRNYRHALERFKLESIINRRTEELVREKEKTDNLLARVLPRETANELKETGKVSTKRFKIVTVLFSDIQGFTKITDELNPENLIDQLDKFFLYFDSVVEKYRIEKIKTIGDAYMCAGGIPHKNRTNPVEVVLAAIEMLYFMREINRQHNPGQNIWDLRIGIDSGPVIAGVVGRNKLSYDIWGSTVNTASRMESSGEVGKINISGNTHMLVQDYFLCTYRGKMPIKNKGDIEMYFVDGIKPSLASNLDCFKPNNDFQIQLQFLRFGDLEEFILEKLEKGLPKDLYYHNLKHTVDVYTQVELIGRSENVTLEEQLLLQTAALFHDAGHLIDYDTHEEMGVKLAREILPEYQYTERQIEIISDLIMITKLPPKPKNLLEAIMCDADLDYLGRTDFIPVSNMLYKELHEHGKIGTIQEWNELQIKFIEKHQYFTNTARKLRNVNKNSQLENIKKWIEKNKL
jgi:class 3 adenylate cyclase